MLYCWLRLEEGLTFATLSVAFFEILGCPSDLPYVVHGGLFAAEAFQDVAYSALLVLLFPAVTCARSSFHHVVPSWVLGALLLARALIVLEELTMVESCVR